MGYGDADEYTAVSFGTDPNAKHVTTWFRHAFTASGLGGFTDLSLQLLCDDGAIIYLNGAEVARTNLPTDPITPTTLASTAITGTDEDLFEGLSVAASALLEGANVLAVEVHQADVTSFDISLDLSLTGLDGLPCFLDDAGSVAQESAPHSAHEHHDVVVGAGAAAELAPGLLEPRRVEGAIAHGPEERVHRE